MKISAVKTEPPSFKGMWNNKIVLKGLETVSEHGSSFIAGLSFAAASGLRPLAIMAAPKVKKENKKYAAANSIVSGFVKFALALLVSMPVENAAKKIEKNPEKFLNPKTIDFFKKGAASLSDSKNFRFISQIIKLGTGFLSAVPKSLITAALIPVLINKFFKEKPPEHADLNLYKSYNPVFSPSFKGSFTDAAAKGIGKMLNCSMVQNAAEKFSSKAQDTARNISIASDLLLTASFAYGINRSSKIKKERKKPLILNNLYGTAASIAAGALIDEAVKKNTGRFIEKFSEINKNNPKLPKYIEGINIIRPALIFAGIYYGILPAVTAYLADKTSEKNKA